MTHDQGAIVRGLFTIDDGQFAALASERRRTVLRCLQGVDQAIAIADLAHDVAAWERDADPTDVPADVIEDVYLTMYHNHVPKLVDEGYLAYEEEYTTVVPTDDAQSLAPLFERVSQRSEE